MADNLEKIKQLRQNTGAGMMDAKSALEQASGNLDKAKDILRQKGQATASKRAHHEARAGLIDAYVHMGRIGAIVEVNCETDFVARTPDFANFVHELAMQVAANAPEYLRPEDVPKSVIDKEETIYKAEAGDKPAEVVEQVIAGKLDKFYQEICLLKQPSLQDPEASVETKLNELIAKLGEKIEIKRFARFELGES